jgi:hypothetical protein
MHLLLYAIMFSVGLAVLVFLLVKSILADLDFYEIEQSFLKNNNKK